MNSSNLNNERHIITIFKVTSSNPKNLRNNWVINYRFGNKKGKNQNQSFRAQENGSKFIRKFP
jgi:hypothetical protein